MNIYLRKILKHDITHQISVTNEVLNGFFGIYNDKESAIMKGKKSGFSGNVVFLLATDPRFGGDIKQIINAEGGMQEDDILLFVKGKSNYTIEVISASDSRHSTFLSMMDLERHLVINVDDDLYEADDDLESVRLTNGSNVLLYGVPGSGKSWTIEHEYCTKETKVDRLVFHPDYTYSDFIGQILPNVSEDGQVSYAFTAGPFTNILKEAYNNPRTEYVLVIEEINRGNAPAIFGEVFQLLDRKAEILDKEDDGFPIGTSEYGITNANMAKIIYGDPDHKVRIPSNLSIIGTMNTSDQNVFTLDTAFQRRWDMRLIENSFDEIDDNFANATILDTAVRWQDFCVEINKIIIGNNARMTSSEDKRLGAYFIHLRDLQYDDREEEKYEREFEDLKRRERYEKLSDEDAERLRQIRAARKQNRKFPEKVLKYLWDDAFKYNREVVFETGKYSSLESIIKYFTNAKGIDRYNVFKENVSDSFKTKNQ
ncbi:McrB family protein [Lachnobacterium bovis]|uniref:AAA domain (Dynein-related subfamily) n=1 Tax=Lachnobacterium bovis DSM 14045 TaxID=1122142 RepID=A0A1H3JWF4_9FIRM|nr:AAA family ATPase [Lachnobacterium bovis]SDY44290.1 AAA domain (dynein-related subfamily) [Lachnobacterium bovis DSM 14045]